MISRIDLWIGKRLFVPVVIRICQAAGITQYAFHSYGWMVACMTVLWVQGREMGWLFSIVIGLSCLFWVCIAALAPGMQGNSPRWLRLFLLSGIIAEAVTNVTQGWDFRAADNIIALAAEYALTIKTIPPRETKQASGKLARQEAK